MKNSSRIAKGILIALAGVAVVKVLTKNKGSFNRERFIEKRLSFLEKVRNMSTEEFSQMKEDFKGSNCQNRREVRQKYFGGLRKA